MKFIKNLAVLPAFLAFFAALPAQAADAASALNQADTTWMMVSAALVMLMTIPGLAMFYAGLVKRENTLTIAMQVFACCALVSILWMVVGYSLSFNGDGPWVGDFSRFFLQGIAFDTLKGTIPENTFMIFQMAFAIITPALIVGAFADRMKFSAALWFMGLWSLIVYAPVCHQVWGGGNLMKMGALDFAGGTVIHVNAGIAGLVACLVLGPRKGYVNGGSNSQFAPSNLLLMLIGAGLLWVGWFGFNAGSALTSGFASANAMVTTQIGAAAAALAWMFTEWAKSGKPTAAGFGCGAVAGLVAITPASGFVDAMGALYIGITAGVICYFASTLLKRAFGYDDSLDVVGVHGVGGALGAVLTGVFAVKAIGGTAGLLEGNSGQVLTQLIAVGQTVLWSAVGTFVILKVIDICIGLRVSPEVEQSGLDVALHGESV